jgi:translocation and assembly module TamA
MSRGAPATTFTLALLLSAVSLAGCASLDFLTPKSGDEPPAGAAGADPERALYELDIAAPAALRTLLKNYLDLSRFQNAPEAEGITLAELDRLIAAAPAQARALLETEGYFNPAVTATRVDGAPGTSAAVAAAGKPLVRVSVEPGPRTRVEEFTLDAAGPLQAAAEAGEADAAALLAKLRQEWPMTPGQAFRQESWSSAKNSTLASLRAEGYPTAEWRRTHAHIDAATNTARLALLADSGPLFRLGALRIEGLQKQDESTVRNLAVFNTGDVYSEKQLLDFQERLQQAGLYEGASVDIDTEPARADAAEVIARIKELPLQQATVGIGYSANTGPRVSFEHMHRRVFGIPWVAKNKFELGPARSIWQGDLTSHPREGQYRNLLGGNAERLKTNDESRTAWSARVGRIQDTARIERLYYVEYVHVRLDSPAGNRNDEALSYNYQWIWRDVDSVLLPTRGSTYSAQGAVGYARSATQDDGPFARAYGRATYYLPLGSWYTTFRAEAAELFARDNVGVPDTLLFRAGGDESVRGYAYRTLGPKVNGVVTSGRVLFTASAELARPISARQPAFWWAAFVDAGNVANDWKDLEPAFGYGLGLRWRSPVGPLRLDLAYGHEIRKFRMHLSVGIAF